MIRKYSPSVFLKYLIIKDSDDIDVDVPFYTGASKTCFLHGDTALYRYDLEASERFGYTDLSVAMTSADTYMLSVQRWIDFVVNDTSPCCVESDPGTNDEERFLKGVPITDSARKRLVKKYADGDTTVQTNELKRLILQRHAQNPVRP